MRVPTHAFRISRSPACARAASSRLTLPPPVAGVPAFSAFDEALAAVKPDVVSINTFPDTHAAFAVRAMEAGAHVFLEKPIAETVDDAERVIATAARTRRKLVVGYILRHHPSWMRFIEIARTLGSPLVFRMNLNQQSSGAQWTTHQRLMDSVSPIVDCGVHYVDVWCQITPARPRRVHAVGAQADRRSSARDVQLRPAAGDLRRRLGRLVRSGLGPDDERDRLFREGRDRPARIGLDRARRPRRSRHARTTSTPIRRPASC